MGHGILLMKLSKLLANRQSIVRRAYLANLADVYRTLVVFSDRIARARLSGWVHLTHANEDEERYWPSLRAMEGSQSVIEEHFTDTEIFDLAEAVAFISEDQDLNLEFPLEELHERFAVPLRAELEECGVAVNIRPHAPHR